MTRILGLCSVLLLAGCATLPPAGAPGRESGSTAPALAPRSTGGARLGIEWLPPVAGWKQDPVPSPRVETRAPRTVPPPALTPAEERRNSSKLERIDEIDNLAERMTLRFVRDLMGDDRRRVQRELGIPMFSARIRYLDLDGHALTTHADELDADDRNARIARFQGVLLNAPFQHALRETPIALEYEAWVDDWKADYVPLSEPFQQARRASPGWGNATVRMRMSNMHDPLEVGWVRRELRVSTSQQKLKVRLAKQLSEKLWSSIRTEFNYQEDVFDVWGELRYDWSRNTTVHFLVGDSIDLLTGSELYPVVESPISLQAADRSVGLVFFVEHIF